MRGSTIVPGSWRLSGGRFPWPTSTTTGLTVAERLALVANADGPRSLRSAGGTLGGLALPPTLAADAGVVWLLDRRRASLRRFDPIAERFFTLPGWGSQSSGAHRFGPLASIAATCGLLTIADPDRGDLVVIATGPLVVRAVLDLPGSRPVAVASHAGRFLVLDDQGRLLVTAPAMDHLQPVQEPARVPRGSWRRIVVDTDGRTCRVDDVEGSLLALTPHATWQLFHSADEVRSRFTAPALSVDRRGRFRVPARFRLPGSDATPCFEATGELCTIEPGEYPGEPPYEMLGSWTGRPLDSGNLGCRWHRVTVSGSQPSGCTTTIETYTSDDPFMPEEVPPDAWSRAHVLGPAASDGGPAAADHAVLSPPGRYLSLRVGLRGNGWATPTVDELLVEPEAARMERFLPAVYRSHDHDADFLRRFLAIFGTELDQVEQSLRSLPARFSPSAVPEAWLDTLAEELGVPLERGWAPAQRRAMLEAAPAWHRSRGTPAAIRALLRTHLEALSGHQLPEPVPVVVEGFRERPAALVGRVRLPMGAGERTWSDQVVDRPALGRRAAEVISLVSVGDRQTDRFRVYANRFKVVVPRPLLPGKHDRESFERLIAAEKPAHVAHELVVVEPQAVVGVQSYLGVDTVVGAWPVARLAPAGCEGSSLGIGLRLGNRGPATNRPPRVGRGGRVGVNTVLI